MLTFFFSFPFLLGLPSLTGFVLLTGWRGELLLVG